MKKMIIGAAVAMLGIATNAATANWSADGIYTYGTDSLNSTYAAFFFETSNTEAANYISYDDAAAALAKGNTSFVSKGFYDDPIEEGEIYGTTTGYGNEETVKGFFLVFDNANVADAKNYYLADEVTKKTGKSGQAAAMYFDISATEGSTAAWTAIAPEPTSGLLMLLGMAGLALRRRRA